LLLAKKGYKVVVIARERPSERSINYTSPWAGAHYRPVPDVDPQTRSEMDLMRVTYKVIKEIGSTHKESGVTCVQGFEYFENPSEAYIKLQGRYSDISGFRVLEKSELPPNVKFGTTYETWCLNPPQYLEWLENQLVSMGVQFLQSNLVNVVEVFTLLKEKDINTVINCSGTGIADPETFPIRGNFLSCRH
jgi:D-amino-acid oxidase